MLTVTVPDEDLLARVSDLSGRVELVLWDLLEPLPEAVAARVGVVQIGHYWVQPDRWLRLHDLPNLRHVLLPSAGFDQRPSCCATTASARPRWEARTSASASSAVPVE